MIEIKDLCCGYKKNKVLSGLSLRLEKGEILSVVGLNGCGKSTLLKAMAGIIEPRNGDIFIDRINTKDLTPRQRACKVAYLTQIGHPSDMTVEELVLLGRFPHTDFPHIYRAADKKAASEAMERLNLGPIAKEPLNTLSGGMLQRAYIAMALCQNSEHILLDEPTAHLDISAEAELMRILRELVDEGRSILLVTHDLPLSFAISDRVAILSCGKIAIEDTPDRVLASGLVNATFGERLIKAEGGYYFDRS